MARTRRSLTDVIAETAPPPPPVQATPAPAPAPARPRAPRPSKPTQATETGPERVVRSTLDLPPGKHADLIRYATDAGLELGWSVRPQHVLRALVDQLLTDDRLRAHVTDALAQQGRPTRRPNS